MKLKLALIFVIPVLLLIGVGVIRLLPAEMTYSYALNTIWDITLPKDYHLSFEETEFGRDGTRYAVLVFDEEPTEFLLDIGFEVAPNETFQTILNDTIEDTNDFDIPAPYMPNWENEYQWINLYIISDGDYLTYKGEDKDFHSLRNLYMVYFMETKTLIVCQRYI